MSTEAKREVWVVEFEQAPCVVRGNVVVRATEKEALSACKYGPDRAVRYVPAVEQACAVPAPAVGAWVPGQPKWDWEPWARFLGARAQLIHEALAEGKSAEEICAQLSMDVGQVRLIGWTDLSSIPGIPGNVWPPPPKEYR